MSAVTKIKRATLNREIAGRIEAMEAITEKYGSKPCVAVRQELALPCEILCANGYQARPSRVGGASAIVVTIGRKYYQFSAARQWNPATNYPHPTYKGYGVGIRVDRFPVVPENYSGIVPTVDTHLFRYSSWAEFAHGVLDWMKNNVAVPR